MTLYMKLQECIEEGREEGRSLGEATKLISLVRRKLARNISVEETADMLEESPERVCEIRDLIQKNPEADDEQIYEKMKK